MTELSRNDIIEKQLLIQEAISKLKHFAKLYGIKSVFVVGGYCREHYLGKLWRVKDIDVASAYHEQAIQLGGLFASEIIHALPHFYARSGAAMVQYSSSHGTIKVEFQGDSIHAYMHNQEVRTWLQSKGIQDVPLINNLYGRDFTINTLIFSLHNENMYDPTGKAIPDLEDKTIRSLLPADMLIKYNPLAALRAIRFAMQYNFRIEGQLRETIKSAGIENLTKSLTEERIIKEIVKILEIDAEKGLSLLKSVGLDRILLHPDVKNYIYLGAEKDASD